VSKSRCASGHRSSLFWGFLSSAFHVYDHLRDTLDNYSKKADISWGREWFNYNEIGRNTRRNDLTTILNGDKRQSAICMPLRINLGKEIKLMQQQ